MRLPWGVEGVFGGNTDGSLMTEQTYQYSNEELLSEKKKKIIGEIYIITSGVDEKAIYRDGDRRRQIVGTGNWRRLSWGN